MSVAVKVVLSNGDDDELDLGTFSQGVIFHRDKIIDIASTEAIARSVYPNWWREWRKCGPHDKTYKDVFVHGA